MFSFGSSKSKQGSQSSSLDISTQSSSSFSDSLSRALSGSRSTSSVFGADILSKLYADAQGASGAIDTGLFTGQAAQLFSGGSQFLESLSGGAGEDYLTSRLGPNPMLDEQIGALSSDVGRFFREELNPAVTGGAVGAGQLGGGRQGVAQGRAIDAASREFQRGATALRSADLTARDSAAAQLMAGRTQAAGTGLAALPGQLGIAEAGMNAGLAPYAALSQILGGPTVLTDASSESVSESVAKAVSEAMGYSYGTSQSTSFGKSSSFNLGFGG